MDKILLALFFVGFLGLSGCDGDKFSFTGQGAIPPEEVVEQPDDTNTGTEEDEEDTDTELEDGGNEENPAPSIPASIVFTEQTGAEVLNERYTLSGRIVQGTSKVILAAISFEGESYIVELKSNGFFSQNFTLKEGENVFIVSVSTNDDKTVTQQFSVYFQPIFTIKKVQPESGYISDKETILFSFEVETNGLQPTVLLNTASVNLNKINDQLFSYTTELSLFPGENNIEVKAIAYNKEKTQNIRYYYQPASLVAPTINVLFPRSNQQTRHSSLVIYFEVLSEYGISNIKVANKDVQFQKTDKGSEVSTVVELQEGENTIAIWAKDVFDQKVSTELIVNRSSQKPEIIFENSLLEFPQINEFEQGKINFKGKVLANNLKSFTVNGQNIKLTATNEQYEFNHDLVITADTEYLVTFTAVDELDNKASRSFNLYTENSLLIDWITPSFPLFATVENGTSYPFAAKAQGITEQHSFKAKLQSVNTEITLQQLGNTITGNLPAGLVAGDYSLVIEAYKDGLKLQELVGMINVSSLESTPLKVIQILPNNEDENIEPDIPLQVNFNRAVKMDEIEIAVKQTLHGLTYVNTDQLGVDFLHSQGYQLREVNRSNAVLEGGISSVNKNQTVLFYPKQDLGYGANINWEIRHKGQTISHQTFKTRSLPTFIEGGIIDANNELVQNVSVEIEELGLATQTNTDGSYNFGYALPAEKNIPDGTYHLVVNKGDELVSYGSIRVAVEINEGVLNSLNLIKIPTIDRSIAPVSTAASSKRLNLAEGDLLLEINGAGEFIASKDKNYLYSNFITPSKSIRKIQTGLAPMWLYQMYPFGAKADGVVDITVSLPRYMGGYDYLFGGEEGESYALILGYSPEKNIIEPIGLGKITGTTLKNVHPIKFSSLDYIGYSPILSDYQNIAEQHAQNNISFSELVAQVLADYR